jgi:RimJ/RimL family protein N-acetyltransferase
VSAGEEMDRARREFCAPVTLEGRWVRLEPLSLDHLDGLCAVGLEPEIWEWMGAPVRTRDEMLRYVESALAGQARGEALPFATVERSGGRVAGSTRFGAIAPEHRRVEIGWTWLGRDFRRTALNTEAKLLMFTHAFERLGCVRVELKTDALNRRSRAAIRRLGAREEGVLRQHMITASGRLRDSVYYSVLDSEWPQVKARLVARLAAGARAAGSLAAGARAADTPAAPPSPG